MKLNNISISYDGLSIFNNFSYEFKNDEIVCIMGPSGCGKTTLLNAISNNVKYTGSIQEIEKTAYVFQSPRLIESISIRKNLQFVLEKEQFSRIEDVLKMLKIDQLIDKYPDNISGGEASRVSIARAILYDPKILLLDEPFKDLDYALKHKLLLLFKDIIKEKKLGCIYVTHDIDEALFMADRILVFSNKPIEVKLDLKLEKTIETEYLTSKEADENRHKIYNALIK